MARISRMCYESNYFHIMVQGINKEYIFREKEFKEKYLEFLIKSTNEVDIKIISYCIMDNHIHLLLYSNEINKLSKVMSSVNTRFAKFYNKKTNRCGYVYRDRYRCENIMSQNHLNNCIRYIHNNPIEANICSKPSEYQYSSYNAYEKRKISDEILELISWNKNDYTHELNGNVGDYHFIETKNEFGKMEYENIYKVFEEYKNLDLSNKETMYYIIKEIKTRTNVTNAEISRLLKISEATLYNILKKHKN